MLAVMIFIAEVEVNFKCKDKCRKTLPTENPSIVFLVSKRSHKLNCKTIYNIFVIMLICAKGI